MRSPTVVTIERERERQTDREREKNTARERERETEREKGYACSIVTAVGDLNESLLNITNTMMYLFF